jgi:DNA-binding IclR family transcriptional regulator
VTRIDDTLEAERAGRDGRLSSVTTAVRLLKAFSADEPEIGLTALARRLGVAKSTVHRLATTLVAEGLLEQNPLTERYRLGIGLFALGTLVRRQMDVSTVSRPLLMSLRQETDETVLLAVMAGTNVMHVYNLESTQAIRMRSDIGVERPAHCTAEATERVIAAGLPPRTANTVTDPDALRDRLERVRRQGHAIDDEECEAGMRCVAAPVFATGREAVAAVAVAGPVQRLSRAAVDALVPLVRRTAASVSERLGHRPTGTW